MFRAMFVDSDKTKESSSEVPFVLRDTTPDIFLPLLEYIYTNCVTLNQKIVRTSALTLSTINYIIINLLLKLFIRSLMFSARLLNMASMVYCR